MKIVFIVVVILFAVLLTYRLVQVIRKGKEEAGKNPYRYPIAFHTVDCAILREQEGTTELLLVQKPEDVEHNLYRFLGGFLDPNDNSAEQAAMREAREESGMEIANPKHVCSLKIDDPRYRDTPHKIITSLYTLDYIFGAAGKGYDDVVKTQWFDINKEIKIHPIHKELLSKLKLHLKSNDRTRN